MIFSLVNWWANAAKLSSKDLTMLGSAVAQGSGLSQTSSTDWGKLSIVLHSPIPSRTNSSKFGHFNHLGNEFELLSKGGETSILLSASKLKVSNPSPSCEVLKCRDLKWLFVTSRIFLNSPWFSTLSKLRVVRFWRNLESFSSKARGKRWTHKDFLLDLELNSTSNLSCSIVSCLGIQWAYKTFKETKFGHWRVMKVISLRPWSESGLMSTKLKDLRVFEQSWSFSTIFKTSVAGIVNLKQSSDRVEFDLVRKRSKIAEFHSTFSFLAMTKVLQTDGWSVKT